jgi:uncharacterized membrane protein (DUF2068 family)
MHPSREDRAHIAGLRAIATTEFLKGLAVVAIGFGLITLSRHAIDLEDITAGLLHFLHVRPRRRLYMVFMDAAARFDDMNLIRVAAIAAVYSMLRFVEAYGLWRARVWGEWLALVSGTVYLPLEIYELIHRPTPVKWVVLVVNIIIVGYIAWVRLDAHAARSMRRPQPASEVED